MLISRQQLLSEVFIIYAFFMRLSIKARNKLKQILQQDYKASISDEEADKLGTSLLKLSALGIEAVQGCGVSSLTRHSGVLKDSDREDAPMASSGDLK